MIERYLERIGIDGADPSYAELHRAHVLAIPYENIDVQLGREIRLDRASLLAKIVDRRRGGYCFEQNTLFAAALEELGTVPRRCLGRVRLGDPISPRPATHMVLVVDDHALDVGFGSANPIHPVPLGGEVSYGPYTWRCDRVTSPEGEAAWRVSLLDMALYTFTDAPQHPVDYLAPNHFSSTHPLSIFTQNLIVQTWEEGDRGLVQVGLVGLELTERLPDGGVEVTAIDPADLGALLRDRFGLDVSDPEVDQLLAAHHQRRGMRQG